MRCAYDKKYSDLTKELGDVGYAIRTMREQVTLSVPLAGGGVATAEIYRLMPPSVETARMLVWQFKDLELAYRDELACPMQGWRASWLNWRHRKRLRALVFAADKLLQEATGEQAFFIKYRGMPALLVEQAKVKLAMVAMVVAGCCR